MGYKVLLPQTRNRRPVASIAKSIPELPKFFRFHDK